MLSNFNNVVAPIIDQANRTISVVNDAYQPYAKPTNLVSYVSSIGLTFYGLFPIWNSPYTSKSSKVTLSCLYGLHIGSVAFALSNLLGQGDYSPSTISALVGASAMFKSFGDYYYESETNQNLKEKTNLVQDQLDKDNFEFNRCLILVEDLKETELELYLLEQEQELLKATLNRLNGIQQKKLSYKTLKPLFDETKTRLKQRAIKQSVIFEFASNGMPTKSSSDLHGEIVSLREEKESKRSTRTSVALDEEIDKLGYQLQYCIKYKKTTELVIKIREQLKSKYISKKEISHLAKIIDDLNRALVPTKHEPSDSDILQFTLDKSSCDVIQTKAWFKKFLKNEIFLLQDKLDNTRKQFIHKRDKFSLFCKFAPNEIHKDFASMYETMKELIELQNQASLAALTEKSKEKNANFSLISSALALMICIVPNTHHIKRLSQLKNGVGFLALLVSNFDMIRKYLLSMKLTAKEEKQIKQLLQDTNFKNILHSNDSHLRQQLLQRMDIVKNNLAGKDEEQVSPRRMAKEKAKVLIFKTVRKQEEKKVSLTHTKKESKRSKRMQ